MSVLPCATVPTDLGYFPDHWRVNYAYGMVMGVDDFRQEQHYHVGRKRLNNRGLHGYGVAYGLDVLWELGEIGVEPGMAVMPGGEDVLVHEKHCLRLDDWLSEHAEEVAEAVQDGVLRVYVTLSYAECLERLVPVPGLACATDASSQEYSRIREAFDLRLELGPPNQAEEWAARRFGDILRRVEIDDSTGGDSDEDEILELIHEIPAKVAAALADGLPQYPPELDGHGPEDERPLRIPDDEARDALQRIYLCWSSHVRPAIQALRAAADPAEGGNVQAVLDAIMADAGHAGGLAVDPDAVTPEDRVVLACLTVDVHEVDGGFAADSVEVDTDVRPTLLNTRAIQELFFAGAQNRGNNPMRFATLHAEHPNRLVAWLHHPEGLTIPREAVEVDVNGVVQDIDDFTGLGSNLIQMTLDQEFQEDARVRVTWDMDKITEAASGDTLLQAMDDLGINYVSRSDRVIRSETILSGIAPTRRFVTVRYLSARSLELWFHTPPGEPLGFPGDIHDRITSFARNDRLVGGFTFSSMGGGSRDHRWRLDLAASEPELKDRERLSFTFDTSTIRRGVSGNRQLRTLISDEELQYTGWDGDRLILVDHWLSVHDPVAERQPTRRFARLCVIAPDTLRMWLSPPHDLAIEGSWSVDGGPLIITVNDEVVREYHVRVVDPNNQVYDVRVAGLRTPLTQNLTQIRVRFQTDRIRLASSAARLSEVLKELKYEYLNHLGKEIWAHHLHCCCETRTCRLASVVTPDPKRLALWFHTDERVFPKGVEMERKGLGRRFYRVEPWEGEFGERNLFQVLYKEVEDLPPVGVPDLSEGERVTIWLDPESIGYGDENPVSLREHMRRDKVRYVCDNGELIRVFHTVHLPPVTRIPDEPDDGRWVPRAELDGLLTERLTPWREVEAPQLFRRLFDEEATGDIERIVDEKNVDFRTGLVTDLGASTEGRLAAFETEFRTEVEASSEESIAALKETLLGTLAQDGERTRTQILETLSSSTAELRKELAGELSAEVTTKLDERAAVTKAELVTSLDQKSEAMRADLVQRIGDRTDSTRSDLAVAVNERVAATAKELEADITKGIDAATAGLRATVEKATAEARASIEESLDERVVLFLTRDRQGAELLSRLVGGEIEGRMDQLAERVAARLG